MNIYKNTKFICGLAIGINFLISYLMLLYQQPFNVDGILYLHTAKAFLTGGIKSAMAVYAWPFYSVLIAVFSKLTFFSLENAAFFLNALLTAILVVAFILLVKELGGKVTEQYLALLIILLFPYLNHDRDNILRDFGYYAFLLISLLFFIRYLHQVNWRAAISWGIFVVIATLFRVEGVFVLLFAPIVIFFKPELRILEKLRRYLQLNIIIIAITCVVAILLLQSHHHLLNLGGMQELLNNVTGWFFSTVDQMTAKNQIIARSVLNPMAASSAPIFMWGGLIAILLESFCKTFGLIYLGLIAYTFIKKRMPKNWELRVALGSYSILIFLTVFAFLVQQYFISQRYVAPLCLIIMLSIPFGLQDILQKLQAAQGSVKTYYKLLIVGLLSGVVVHSFGHLGVSKTYIMDAGTWIKQNTLPTTKVYSNSAQVFYYSDRPGMQYPKDFSPINHLLERLKKINIHHYDYLALWLDHHQSLTEQEVINWLKKQPIKRFNNRRGDRILIFKL